MQDTVVVLGAGGFLGRYICREFYDRRHRVAGVGRTTSAMNATACFLPGDLLEMDLSAFLHKEKPRWVINAAGGASVGKSFEQPYEDWRRTVQVQARILEAIRQSAPQAFYIFLSSAAVYGEPSQLPVTEEMSCNPISPYGMHKWQAEILQEEYSRFYGLQGAVLRIFSAYGEGLQRQVIYDLCQKIRQSGTKLEVYGTGKETRDFIHADDVARAIHCVANQCATGTFNVASGQQICIGDLARLMVEELRPGLPIVFTGEGKEGDPLQWEADVSRLQRLGFRVTDNLRKIASVVRSYG